MPNFEVPGDPDAVVGRVTLMQEQATTFTAVATGLEKITTDGWTGRAADRFRERFEPEPERWHDAGNGFRTAAAALSRYAEALRSAQSRARWAQGEHARGDEVTLSARAAYDADVSNARRDVAIANAAGHPTTLTIVPFDDPGASIRSAALAELASVRVDLDGAAHACAGEVRAGCATAPEKRNWFESGVAFVGGVLAGAGEAVWDLAEMGFDFTFGPYVDLLSVATGDVTVEELAAKNQLKMDQATALFNAIKDDPMEFGKNVGKSLLDWDTWSDDPARALGHLVPDAVATVLSGGAGAGARALRGLEGLHDVSLLSRPLHGLEALRGTKVLSLAGLSKLDDAALLTHLDELSDLDRARLLRRGEDLTPRAMEDLFSPRRNGEPANLGVLDDTFHGGAPQQRLDHPPFDGSLVNLHGRGDPGSGLFWTDPAELLSHRTEGAAMDRLALRPEWYTKEAADGGHVFSHRDEITLRDFSSAEDHRMNVGAIAPQDRFDALDGWRGEGPAPADFDGRAIPDIQPGGATQYVSGLDDAPWTRAAPSWTGPAPWVSATPNGAWVGFAQGTGVGVVGSAATGASAQEGP